MTRASDEGNAGSSGRDRGQRLVGVVGEFDEHAGLGTVVTQGGNSLPFHCTQIADGSRIIPVGTRVTFVVVPGRGGRWEAGDLRPGSTGEPH